MSLTKITFEQLTSIENLFQAWSEFKKGKGKKKDVQEFTRHLEDNLFALGKELKNKTYQHGSYKQFIVHDPKRRQIHKAEVRDRVIHHLLYKYLYDLFDKTFIFDSYSCRLDKGTHRGVKRLEKFTRIVSKNYIHPCWALKLDIRKFFASLNHKILKEALREKITDKDIAWLLNKVIDSFLHEGIPLGNLTSQIFANIYMNRLDRFVKHQMRVKYYLRYADDILILSNDKKELQELIKPIEQFLKKNLNLELHPKKIILRKLKWGIDFLGYIVLPHYRLPRTKTRRRIFKKLIGKINSPNFNQSLQSYLGYLKHSNSFKFQENLLMELFPLREWE